MDDERRRAALADFLRTRRARVTPAAAGLPPGPRRRTPGLRREEVAQVASVSAAWYTWLEQGRDIRASRGVLESIAAALRLTPDERRHLFLLADQPLGAALSPASETVSAAHQRVLDGLGVNPAYMTGRRSDILAWNRAATAVLGDFAALPARERNTIWRLFATADCHLFADWEDLAQRALAQFRADSARYVGDPWFAELIDDLQRVSPEFRAWWPRHDVLGMPDGRKVLNHPTAGRLALEHTTFQVPDAPDLKLVVYTPLEADTATRLARLLAVAPGVSHGAASSEPGQADR